MTRPSTPEPICTGCHDGDMADFDHYCDSAGIRPGEEPAAFAAWLNAMSGWDGPMEQLPPAENGPQRHYTLDLGGLDGDYPHCETCRKQWPCPGAGEESQR